MAQGGTSWGPAAVRKSATPSLQPLFVCEKPECPDGTFAASCETCTACPPKQCPTGQILRVAGCSGSSGGECVALDCKLLNATATLGGAACICQAGFFGDGQTCLPCPTGQISKEGSTLISECAPPQASPQSQVTVAASYIASMVVRFPGTQALFDAARQQQLLAALQKSSPSALNVSISSITPVSVGRRRLFASFLDIGVEFSYKDKVSADSAAATDLTESNLNIQMIAAGLDTLVVTAQPTVRSVATDPDTSTLNEPEAAAAIPTWVIIVASVGGVLAVGVGVPLIVWRMRKRDPVLHEKPILDDGDLQKLRDAVLAGEPVGDSKFIEEAKDLITGEAKAAAEGLETLLCVGDSKETFYRRIALGVAGIQEEVKQFVQEHGESDAGVGEIQELFNYIVYEGTSEKKYPNGIRDEGRKPGTRLTYFVSHPKANKAGLSPAHVVALRMYTTSIYKYMNNPLRDRNRRKKNIACPLPVTTWYICPSQI